MDTKTHSIKPERITTPIQLLGAWLVGLLSIDSCFLFAVANMDQGSWESVALTIAAIVNVPLFIGAVFLLQTKFRPELQEDSYYSSYLSQKTNEVIKYPNLFLLRKFPIISRLDLCWDGTNLRKR